MAEPTIGRQSGDTAPPPSAGAARGNETLYRGLFDAMTEGLVLHQMVYGEDGQPLDYVILEANPAFERHTGFRREATVGKRATEAYGVAKAPCLEIYARVARTREPVTFDENFDEWRKTFRITAFSPEVGRFATIFEDITERARTTAAVRDSEARLRAILNAAQESIWMISPEGVLMMGNEIALARLGKPAEQVFGRHCSVLLEPELAAARMRRIREVVQTGKPVEFEDERDGMRFHHTFYPAFGAGGVVTTVVAFSRDIAERIRLEESLRQAQKMESIGRLAGGIAHDFNNMLQTILGFNELLLGSTDAEDARRADLEEVRKAATQAADLTRQLLAFSRRQTLLPQVMDLNHALADSDKMLRRLLGEDVQLELHLDPQLARTLADPGQIGQIVMNLAVNARDAMPGGGRLTLSTGNVEFREEDVAALPEAQAGRFVCLAVSDTGGGMNAAVQQHIFEPFFTTKGLGKGTGLGLAVIYGIIKQSNGWIHVYSEEGQGTTFKIYLPAFAAVEVDETAPSAGGAEVAGGRGERILLVEDEAGVRNLAARVCRAAGYDVVACASAAEAEQAWAREDGRFDLLVSDVVLSDRSGIELAARFAAQRPALPVVLCSGYSDERARWSDIAEKNYRYLEKPYPAATLLAVVRETLAGRA